MTFDCKYWFIAVFLLLGTIVVQGSLVSLTGENGLKTAVFLSPKFEVQSGEVSRKNYFGVDFPQGHIAIKDFNAEIIDEAGNSVPLHETYVHHWVMIKYYQHKSNISDLIMASNSGPCETLTQYWGLGSETRRTLTHIPDPYGIEVGNPMEIPDGYEEKWFLNVHAIDTRGTEDRLGCIECRCDLYNVTIDEFGRNLEPDYLGGLRCCYDQTRCRTRKGVQSSTRSLYLKYTVKYLDWSTSVVPVKIYILDVTDRWTRGLNSTHDCLVEYQVESCSSKMEKDNCYDPKNVSVVLPGGGHVIYGVAHQHAGGIGSTLYGEDGRVICSSMPTYGQGNEAGNEAGYIVGMSTCYPQPGAVKILDGELLTLVSNYSSTIRHTGVMGLFYILVANSDK